MHIEPHHSYDLTELMRLERRVFAAKVRMARALLGLSQSEFGYRVGLTQRAIHKLEQGETEPRRATVRAIEVVWHEHAIEFEDLADGGFRVGVRASVFEGPVTARARRERSVRTRLGVTATVRRGLG
jgi:transcriptional regulator with XRE-family HTH domain